MVRLRGAPTVTVLVPTDRVFGPERPPKPPRPFVGVGVPVSAPFLAAGMDGSAITLAVHSYTETRGDGDQTVSGEAEASALNRVIATALGDQALSLADTDCPYPAVAHFEWTGSRVIQDGNDAGQFHGIVSFAISVVS